MARTSTTRRKVFMKLLLKYLTASWASAGDLKPTKPNCRDLPSLHAWQAALQAMLRITPAWNQAHCQCLHTMRSELVPGSASN